ncbi:sensor histidine kinase [Actinomadura rayongensis]
MIPGPLRTVRMRLTLFSSGLYLLTSLIALTVVNVLLREMLQHRVDGLIKQGGDIPPPGGVVPPPRMLAGTSVIQSLPDQVLHYQWGVTGATLAVLAVVSLVLGRWIAGRMLRPLHDITAAARHLSLSNLHERIALDGPRDELKDLADTFDAMLERLDRSVRAQRRFIADAAHELRTPLAVQRAAIQIGLDDPLPDRLVPVRTKLLTANRRTERLIDALLILAQAEHGLDGTEPVALDVLARQAAEELPAGDVTVTLTTERAVVAGDPVLLNRLLANVLGNAVRYNRPGGTVLLALSAAGTLTVRNTGPEVPADRVAELFQPFRRLHADRSAADGTGLGLSIVASIAQAHGASVDARPNPGGGLELTLRFPVL